MTLLLLAGWKTRWEVAGAGRASRYPVDRVHEYSAGRQQGKLCRFHSMIEDKWIWYKYIIASGYLCIFHTCINFILQRNQAVGCLIRKSWPVSKIPAQVLTLINGDRISMPPMVRLLFEVADLAQASPATVSRAGMATKQHWFLNIDGNLGWYKLILLFAFWTT